MGRGTSKAAVGGGTTAETARTGKVVDYDASKETGEQIVWTLNRTYKNFEDGKSNVSDINLMGVGKSKVKNAIKKIDHNIAIAEKNNSENLPRYRRIKAKLEGML